MLAHHRGANRIEMQDLLLALEQEFGMSESGVLGGEEAHGVAGSAVSLLGGGEKSAYPVMGLWTASVKSTARDFWRAVAPLRRCMFKDPESFVYNPRRPELRAARLSTVCYIATQKYNYARLKAKSVAVSIVL